MKKYRLTDKEKKVPVSYAALATLMIGLRISYGNEETDEAVALLNVPGTKKVEREKFVIEIISDEQ